MGLEFSTPMLSLADCVALTPSRALFSTQNGGILDPSWSPRKRWLLQFAGPILWFGEGQGKRSSCSHGLLATLNFGQIRE